MFLTRMHLNLSRVATQRLLASRQRLHATVMQSFPPGADLETDESRVLWRLDRQRESTSLFISSPARPDLTGLAEQCGWPASDATWDCRPLATLVDRLSAGQGWAFRVTVNPTRSTATEHGARGKRSAHVTAEQQQEWFLQRADGWGFAVQTADDVPRLALTDRGRDDFGRSTDGTRRTVPVSYATLDGALTVTDPAALRRALGLGLGRAKAYGCGLMTLAPLA